MSYSHKSLGKAVSPVQKWRPGLHGATSPGLLQTCQSPMWAVMGSGWERGGQLIDGCPGPPAWPSCPRSHQLPLTVFFMRKLSRVAVLSPHHNSFS